MHTVWRALRARPRLVAGVVAAVAGYTALPFASPLSRALVAWDVGCLLFLLLCAWMFSTTPSAAMPRVSEAQEAGEWTVFWLTVAGVVASFGAIIGEFSDASGAHRGFRVAVVAATLLLSWLTTHTVFSMRYAHEYYDLEPDGHTVHGGLEFPGEREPDYWDFFYFGLVLGMTFQVSDVQITDHHFRRLAAAHGLLGFLFNTVILALTINLAAGLFAPAAAGG
ncbi:MAG: DUF1345 domain-containing protein [Acidisphaera sp.]|nr:DUF1345 domain-containing protein [Acidisphaera sp.]MBV9812743.1 DUF1345 domain-containing protein [Acetobacteraceae bacterium]